MKKLLNNDFDERQLKIRGAVYLHTLIVMALLILANAFLRMNGVIWADELYQALLLIMLPVTVGSIELICKDAYIGVRRSYRAMIMVLGLCGMVGFFPPLVSILSGRDRFLANGSFTALGLRMMVSFCCLSISTVFTARYFYERQHRED
ncbi:hypothetical protein [Diplocloster modestus]|uniref:Uncharacterized protein n=1 Tax=Diplocloster modestus TaxID=2850322 RepID=A0ABS6KAA5_9FIRM|nr:hypothetical protein [Diplocloster modestus]MBU9727453.1 hypothetical protein [Diplocloster modestus]